MKAMVTTPATKKHMLTNTKMSGRSHFPPKVLQNFQVKSSILNSMFTSLKGIFGIMGKGHFPEVYFPGIIKRSWENS